MKNRLAAIVAVFVFLLAGCSSTKSEPVTITPSNNQIFLSKIHHNTNYFDKWSVDRTVNLAHTICQAFDHGGTFDDVSSIFLNKGVSPHDAGYFIGASIGVYCPKHIDLLQTQTMA